MQSQWVQTQLDLKSSLRSAVENNTDKCNSYFKVLLGPRSAQTLDLSIMNTSTIIYTNGLLLPLSTGATPKGVGDHGLISDSVPHTVQHAG